MSIDWQDEHHLCAWVDGQQVAMLDISTDAGAVTINMLYVKPPFRRRGIGRALLQQLELRHPQAIHPCNTRRCNAALEV